MNPLERVLDRCEIGDCWEWQGSTAGGYGRISVNNRVEQTHRVVHESLVGSIPEGKQLDHLCRNRVCCNPDHLQIVTQRENVLRGAGITAQNAKKVLCPRGHRYEGDNLYVRSNGHRMCRACHADRERKRKLRTKPKEEQR